MNSEPRLDRNDGYPSLITLIKVKQEDRGLKAKWATKKDYYLST